MMAQVSSASEKLSEQSHKELSEGKKFDTKFNNKKHDKHLDLDTGVSSVK